MDNVSKIQDYTAKSLANHVTIYTSRLLEDDAKVLAALSLQAVNNEKELWTDVIEENEFYEELSKIDSRFIVVPSIICYKYAVESKPTMLLIGDSLETAEDIPGWNIYLTKYSIWSDGDVVPENRTTITATTNEKEIDHLKDIVKHSAIFTIAFELEIEHFKVYDMFFEPKPEVGEIRDLSKGE